MSALSALARVDALDADAVGRGLQDQSPLVRRRAAELSAGVEGDLGQVLRSALGDADALVVEAVCFALGERRDSAACAEIGAVAREHHDIRCREASIAALGAIGDPGSLPVVLDALKDKATIRRRAVVALAAFVDPRVELALQECLADRDWQVRQAAEILLEG
jgi:HEAT repeat protein